VNAPQAEFLYVGYVMGRQFRLAWSRTLRRGVTGFFLLYCNRFIGIPSSKVSNWWVCFMLEEPLPGKLIFPIDTIF
jgi:hypothetical protein